MLCDKCKQKPATYHSTISINGNVTNSHLCSECAIGENKVTSAFNAGSFFTTPLFNINSDLIAPNLKPTNKTAAAECKICGLTFDEFAENGLLTCSGCYEAFGHNLLDVIKGFQPDIKHTGKVLKRDNSTGNAALKNLEFKLKQAVAGENYELASQLKKQIIQLKKEGKNEY